MESVGTVLIVDIGCSGLPGQRHKTLGILENENQSQRLQNAKQKLKKKKKSLELFGNKNVNLWRKLKRMF